MKKNKDVKHYVEGSPAQVIDGLVELLQEIRKKLESEVEHLHSAGDDDESEHPGRVLAEPLATRLEDLIYQINDNVVKED